MAKQVSASSGNRRPTRRQLLAFLGVMVLLIVGMSVWAVASPTPEKAVIGKWTNIHGGSISFYADGTGFVPGVPGVISDTNFSYFFPNSSHVTINIQGQAMTVGIKVDGDTMKWSNTLNNTVNEYTRAR